MRFYATLTIAVVVVMLLAEISPELVNAFLMLLLLGIVLGRYQAFQQLVTGLVGNLQQSTKQEVYNAGTKTNQTNTRNNFGGCTLVIASIQNNLGGAQMRTGDIIAGFVFLIAVYLVFTNWRGANALLRTVFGGTASLTKTLQGR